jgi:predicted small lipoprotein YifL
MKTCITTLIIIMTTISLSACSSSKPLTEQDQAAKYGMSMQEYKEQKEAAARMNMNMEDHMKTMGQ